MAYTAIGDKILAENYNIFVAGSGAFGAISHAVANINTVWGEGNGDKGYGQSTTLTQAPAASVVSATQWASMMTRLISIDAHQGGAVIVGNIPGDLTTVASNALVVDNWYEVQTVGTGNWPSAGHDAGVSKVTLGGTNNSTGYTDGAALTIGAPDLTGGVQAVGIVTTYQDGALIEGESTFIRAGVEINEINTYFNVNQKSTSGSGFGAEFEITKAGGQIDYSDLTITITNPGYGYLVSDTITIDGTRLGGATITNDLTLTIGTFVANGTICGTGITTIGSGYDGAPVPTVSAGTGVQGTLTLTAVVQDQIFKATATTNGQSDGTARRPAIITDQIITYIDTLSAAITAVYATPYTTIAPTTTLVENIGNGAATWANTSTFTINVQFTSGDHARYFFNSGGNIDITAALTGGTPAKTDGWDDGSTAGILPESGTVTLGAHATTKTGGSGVLNTDYYIEATTGYYELGIADIQTYQQFLVGGGVYGTNNMTIEVKTNGVQGSAGDNGSLITFTVTLNDVVVSGDPVDGTTTVTATVNYPDTTYVTESSWGVPTFAPASGNVQT